MADAGLLAAGSRGARAYACHAADTPEAPELTDARAAYERAIRTYHEARRRGPRFREWEAATAADRARLEFYRLRDALHASPSSEPSFAPPPSSQFADAIKTRAPARRTTLSLAFNIAMPTLLFLGVAVPLAIFAITSAQQDRTSSAASSGRSTQSRRAPALSFAPEPGSKTVSRSFDLQFTSDLPLQNVGVTLVPDAGVACAATLETATQGRIRCQGLLPGGKDFTARITAVPLFATRNAEVTYEFRTLERITRLEGVKWFTEFENPVGEPFACAAASCRIIQNFTTGIDKMSAEGILAFGRQFNRSRDPGLDPAAIAETLRRLDGRNQYHYYIFGTRQEATEAAVYWLTRSGKPVVAITLGGQHAPLVVGFTGEFGDRIGDPRNRITTVIVMDPQRGDVDPRTARFRPDKSRSLTYQTGHELTLQEWFFDDWWLGASYTCCLDGVNIDRNDGAYPLPHWAGNFVIIVDDGDRDWPSDRLGRVIPRT